MIPAKHQMVANVEDFLVENCIIGFLFTVF